MLRSLARSIFGSANDRLVKSLAKEVGAINALEPTLESLTDEQLRARTDWLRDRLAKGETVDKLLIDAFATVREAAKRVLGMRHFDVQLIGGIVLHRGMIAEMRTGEGKTLVATLPSYLNALSGKGVHVVTVNDYLAKRDAAWMGKIHEFLGLSVGVIVPGIDEMDRKAAYAADITYATNNELGFDYLRDNMRYELDHMVQRPHHYAIVDEVDSILIDEARTPLIISGPTEDNSELYKAVNTLVPSLTYIPFKKDERPGARQEENPSDIEKDEKSRSVNLTEGGTAHMEALLVQAGLMGEGASLYDIDNISLVHHVNQALKAHHIFARDVDYIVKGDKVVIIDEFTGRMMDGRRYSEGLHQALEAKEGVTIQNENQTLASITFQNYFRMYPKLSGMTGTAMTEAGEFSDIYKLHVIEIPTHRPVARSDADDEIYKTNAEKHVAVVQLIKECQARNQPILVGTVSIDKSELLAELLKKEGVPHHVLNARYHEQEASIVAQAGRPGAVTIATNMAGRGTDIMLGGNAEMRIEQEIAQIADEGLKAQMAERIRAEVAADKEVVRAAGGLYIMGTERHESRRIDNQLRGRSGRQGDPGNSKFYLSLEDDLLRIFGSEKMEGWLTRFGLKEGEAIFHPWMNKAIERAQTRVEQRNYEIRKNVLKYDDVMNDQRKVIFDQRIDLMQTDDVAETIAAMREEVVVQLVGAHVPHGAYAEQWDAAGLSTEVERVFGIGLPVVEWAREEGIANEELKDRILAGVDAQALEKEQMYGPEVMRNAEKRLLLQTLDHLWKEHLHQLDHLRQGIYLRGYGQKDPLNEYKQEAFTLFEHMLTHLRERVVQALAHVRVQIETSEGVVLPFAAAQTGHTGAGQNPSQLLETHGEPAASAFGSEAQMVSAGGMTGGGIMPHRVPTGPRDPADPASWGRVSRNDVCPCGSGKKYKFCHGALA